jgi:hypothetical protein
MREKPDEGRRFMVNPAFAREAKTEKSENFLERRHQLASAE